MSEYKNYVINKSRLCLLFVLFISSTAFNQNEIIVAKDGSGNFKNIQDAINSLSISATSQRIICIKSGVYNDKIFIDKNFITLKGENKADTKIIISEARDIFRCSHADDWGVAAINIKASDINLENLTFINEYGLIEKNEINFPCEKDSISKQKLVKKDGHQMVLRSFNCTRLISTNCIFRSYGGDPVSPWNGEDGMFYFKDCIIEGGVDLYCPRGWSLAENCQFICHSKEAAIWHDGSKNQSSKSVFFNCQFMGDDGFKLGRYHKDAQFFLIDCSFAKNMANADIYQKMATPANVLQWNKRVYYYNCHTKGGDYDWHKNNLPTTIGINDINVPWVFDYKWKPTNEPTLTVAVEPIHTNTPTINIQNTFDTVAENMLLYQRSNGGWPKQFNKEKVNYNRILSPSELSDLKKGFDEGIDATIDNNATTKEIKYLAKEYKKTNDQRFLSAAEKGVEYLLKAQYKNGGWPQFYPDFSSYRSQVTFNDNAMINVLNLLVDIIEGNNSLDVISQKYINGCSLAMQKGIACILKTQVKQQGKLTAWCAQYDAQTLLPAKARAYELPSLSGQETVGIIRFLMRFENPNPEIKLAINSAIDWFEKVKIVGYKFVETPAPNTSFGKDKVLLPEPGNIMWARFYELENNEPFFCGRDGEKKKTVAEVEQERRIGYAWYNQTPNKLLNEEYPAWKAKWIK